MRNMSRSRGYDDNHLTIPEDLLAKGVYENEINSPLLDHGEQKKVINAKDGQIIFLSNKSKNRRKSDVDAIGPHSHLRTDMLHSKIREKLPGFSNIIGQDKKMLDVFQQIKDVTSYNYPVHISGETGTGKELIAEAIHKTGPRKNNPFVPINCGALPEGLVESELFGHVKGAFSGAIRDKKGRFELANGGTVFLDEVAELSKYMQVKLLRFLQDGMFEKVGGEKTVSVNVRIISATNKDLKEEIKKNLFRDDLYYRLKVIPIHLPALRERKGDIRFLVHHFAQQAEKEYNTKPIIFNQDVVDLLTKYRWPGNIRELQNAVQFAIVRSTGNEIMPQHLPIEITNSYQHVFRRGPARKLDVEIVSSAILKAGGNKAKAARYLGVGRATLYRFLDEHPEVME